MAPSKPLPRVPVERGALIGVGAFLAGYGLTYLLLIGVVSSASLTSYVAAITGEPADWRVVGWLFFNAHGVGTLVPELFGPGTTHLLWETTSLTLLAYLIPAAVLFTAGVALRYGASPIGSRPAAGYGLAVLLGYTPAAMVGAMVVTASTNRGPAGPEPLAALVVAGVVYPALVVGLGAASYDRWRARTRSR